MFKKAFELAVLCRAEVAVIVFAGNKKLYEFASSDMKDVLYRYTQVISLLTMLIQAEPYEHRGPDDFQNKEDGDSDDSFILRAFVVEHREHCLGVQSGGV